MLANFFLTKSIHLGKSHHVLRYSDNEKNGQEFTPLAIHLKDLIEQGRHQETIRVAGPHLANFLDYFHEGLQHISPTTPQINLLYRNYHSFLTAGRQSYSDIVQSICQSKPSPEVSISTSQNYHSFITPFLKKLKDIQKKYNEYIDNGLIAEVPETSNLINCLLKITPTSIDIKPKEHAARRKYGTPSTAATGTQSARSSLTSHIPYEPGFEMPLDENKFFPLEKISDLIRNASCYRNSCLYALIAATNARCSEADQILWRDIDIGSREIFLINPSLRQNPNIIYRGLSETERNKLEWKGRATPLTVLLEPYGSLFFEYLELYIQYEYQPSCGHNFVFHNRNGQPLFLCDYSSVTLAQFKNAARKTLADQPHLAEKLGLHSLRHSNIYFWKNYLEHSQGIGLSDSELMLLTGHIDIRSLQKYAKADWEMLLEKISYANHSRKHGNTKSITEFQIHYLEERLKIFKEILINQQREAAHHD
ncbi:tyrosine-type recombinase/integrase [Pseudomonas putida]|nr:tyrosine-type recombinase/integrase [Pseudomonas putida]MDY4318877.1 tyrosine-type recombinase/integrase [Pseudomonas putida]MDY4352262.1 tyrosine-type recombinase/integrase [Pseudomonas putida]